MALGNFEKCLAEVLKSEGGYVNNPKDPGGETNKGITLRTYQAYCRNGQYPKIPDSVRDITDLEVKAIYKKQYWDQVKGDELPRGVDYVVFDGAVNSGVRQSVRWLQMALGVTVDGVIGLQTLDAMQGLTEKQIHELIGMDFYDKDKHDLNFTHGSILSARLSFLEHLSTWATFGKGWSNRLVRVGKTARMMVYGAFTAPSALPTPQPEEGAKALKSDIKAPPSPAAGDAAAGAGAMLTGAIATASQTIAPFAGSSPFATNVMIALALAGIITTAGGIAWRLYANWQADKQAKALGQKKGA